ncbi:MAG TPA: class I SAM-dependent methyltransferase [Pyrinomonadaceae bacterium]|nr:class I SAM-dependent methyltransferase [Pyrinomonadaceae bacterium]
MSDQRIYQEPRLIEHVEDCYFYHTMELPGLGVRKGHWDLRNRFEDYIGGVQVSGKSVLDVGTATGFLSFEAERFGAREVVSFDMSDVRQQTFVPFKNRPYREDYQSWVVSYAATIEKWKNAYWLCHRLLNSKAKVFYGDIFTLPAELGEFEVVIVGAVLEHLRDPIGALTSIAHVVRERLVLITPLIESDEKFARFEPAVDRPGDDFTWWTYSIGLYRELLGILGFEIEKISRAEYFHEYENRMEERSTLVAVKI